MHVACKILTMKLEQAKT